jgi:hypothetical protein
MRILGYSCNSPLFRLLVAGLLLAACTPAYAGLFSNEKHDPVPQWGLDAAKTPTPANVKDAPSVVLFDEYVETVDAQGRATEREREAIRILKPQGRHDGCHLSYDIDEKINYFREWTITADGKQFEAQEGDFVDVGDPYLSNFHYTGRTRVVQPPAAEIGSTILCETEELLAPYQQETIWGIQSSIPVAFQALEVDLPPGRAHSEAWHKFSPIKPVEVAPNHWRWEIKDMPALDLRELKSGPPHRVLFARMSVHWDDAAAVGKDDQWRAIGQWVTKLQASRPDPSPEITAQTQSLIAGAPDFYTKLSRITEYIQKNIQYFIVERGIGGWQAHPASEIFRNRYGDCKDKTTILISMLQVAGIHAQYLSVDSHRGYVDPEAPSRYSNHMITAIEIPADVQDARLKAIVKAKDGKRYLIFDPTDERTPVGNLRSALQGSYGVLSAGPASQIIALPVLEPETNTAESKGAFTLAADGTLDSFQLVEPSALDKPIELHYKVTARQYSHQAGPLLLVRPRVVGSFAQPFDDKPRIYPIDLEATGRWRDSFDIAIPAGYTIDETPDPVALDLDFVSYHSTVTAKGSVLHYEREYIVRQVEIPAARMDDFRRLESTFLSD